MPKPAEPFTWGGTPVVREVTAPFNVDAYMFNAEFYLAAPTTRTITLDGDPGIEP